MTAAAAPWGTPWLQLVDTLRVVCIAFACVGVIGVAVRVPFITARQRAVIVALTLAAASIVETEWHRLGYGIGRWGRLWFNLVAMAIFAGWAVVATIDRNIDRPGR